MGSTCWCQTTTSTVARGDSLTGSGAHALFFSERAVCADDNRLFVLTEVKLLFVFRQLKSDDVHFVQVVS